MRIDKLLNIKYPIIQGGMANIATGKFAAAASNAGGLGLIGSGGMKIEQLEEQIAICKKLTDKPFGVNIMLLNPYADQMAELLIREKVAVVTTGAGSPNKYMDSWKAAGIKVMPVVASTTLAKRLESAGADVIIAEGCECGGHIGELTTMAMVPQIVDAVSVPVVAAGGIADGRQLLAAFALGASGVQLGTCLLVSEECPIHENYKQAVLKAKDSDTIVTGRISGTPVRGLKNKMARAHITSEKAGEDKLERERLTLGSLRKAVFDGDVENGSLMAGQVAGQLKEIKPIKQIFEDLMSGYEQTYKVLEKTL